MKMIVGLGNPGAKYENTRHNIGFMYLNAYLARKFGNEVVWLEENKFHSHVFRTENTLYVKPQTFMNVSGSAVSKLVQFYKIDLADLLIVHDDVDLELGDARLKKGSGSAGHHGVEDIISRLGSNEFSRVRVGVGRPKDARFNVEDYVVQVMSPEELTVIKNLFDTKVYSLIDSF